MGITVRNLSVGYQKPLLTGVHFTLQNPFGAATQARR